MGLVFLCVFNILYLGTGSYVAQARRALSVANDNLDSLYAKVTIRRIPQLVLIYSNDRPLAFETN